MRKRVQRVEVTCFVLQRGWPSGFFKFENPTQTHIHHILMSPAQGETPVWFEERMGRWMLLQKGPEDTWKREEDRKGVCDMVSRLYICPNPQNVHHQE